MAKYRVERAIDTRDLAFYIENSLQFDTRDEYIYHESLFLPPIAIASARNKASIDGLILGGGDGLGAREALKFQSIRHIDLVDYDPEIVRLAREEWSGFNKASLDDQRVTVHIEEASRFLKTTRPLYDYIVTDFTFPEDLAGCSLFTEDFFHDIAKRLKQNGVIALNTCSPQRSPEAYWSIYRTLSQVKLYPKPLQIRIPSFSTHGYGDWGFFLASLTPILSNEIQNIILPADRRFITDEIICKAMAFESSVVLHGLNFGHVIYRPEDLMALLNTSGIFASLGGKSIDFSKDMLPLEVWKYFESHPEHVFFSMSAYWKERVFNILNDLDWKKFIEEVEKNLVRCSKEMAREIRLLLKNISRRWDDADFRLEAFQRAFVALLAIIIVMNMLCPDNAFAKGYYGGHHYGNSGGAGTQISLVAPAAATAFYNNYWLTSLYVPDMAGKPHSKLFFPASSSSDVSDRKPEQAFFALNDTTYITEQGDIFQLIPKTHFLYKVEPDRIVLFQTGQQTPIIEMALDQELADSLEKDIEANRKALVISIKQFEQWLNWSGPTETLVKEVADERKELDKLKMLQKILDGLHKNIYVGSSVESLDTPSLRLAPAVRLTTDGSLTIKTTEGSWKNYPFRAFSRSGTREVLSSNASLDLFCEELLKGVIQTLKPQDPARALIVDKMGSQ